MTDDPRVDDVREWYVMGRRVHNPFASDSELVRPFDLWLAEHDQEVRAESFADRMERQSGALAHATMRAERAEAVTAKHAKATHERDEARAALARVKALHLPEARAHDGSGEWSVPLHEWPSDEYEGNLETLPTFEVCAHCGQIEMRESQGDGEHASYLDAMWPCATIRALEGENDE